MRNKMKSENIPKFKGKKVLFAIASHFEILHYIITRASCLLNLNYFTLLLNEHVCMFSCSILPFCLRFYPAHRSAGKSAISKTAAITLHLASTHVLPPFNSIDDVTRPLSPAHSAHVSPAVSPLIILRQFGFDYQLCQARIILLMSKMR
jgi:hypothetical protein